MRRAIVRGLAASAGATHGGVLPHLDDGGQSELKATAPRGTVGEGLRIPGRHLLSSGRRRALAGARYVRERR
jgi:hypothetical protein